MRHQPLQVQPRRPQGWVSSRPELPAVALGRVLPKREVPRLVAVALARRLAEAPLSRAAAVRMRRGRGLVRVGVQQLAAAAVQRRVGARARS
jgi:hypothetical protein